MSVKGCSMRWKLLCMLVLGVIVIDGSSNGTPGDKTLMNDDLDSVLDARTLIPVKQPLFSRRITAFQRANHWKDARQRLPSELVPIVAMYIYYDWKNLVNFVEDPIFASYLLQCESAGPAMLEWRALASIEINSAGDLIWFKMWHGRCRKELGDSLKLPSTLITMDFRGIGLCLLDTGILPRGLQRLDLSENKLKHLDLDGLPRRLSTLRIGHNPLEDLDLSALPQGLKELHLPGLKLKEVELQWLAEGLETLDLSDNRLERLDLTDTRNLITIDLWGQPGIQLNLPTGATRDDYCCDEKTIFVKLSSGRLVALYGRQLQLVLKVE